jgi:protein-tyrosine phosphatase
MQIHRIDGPWTGKLAIVARPRGGDWLADDVRFWKETGLEVIVSLLTKVESNDFELGLEKQLCEEIGLRFIAFPITDLSVPSSNQATLELLSELENLLSSGKNVGIHCRQGIGRSGLIASSLLVAAGLEAHEAFGVVSSARRMQVPETSEQRDWVVAFARQPVQPVSRR